MYYTCICYGTYTSWFHKYNALILSTYNFSTYTLAYVYRYYCYNKNNEIFLTCESKGLVSETEAPLGSAISLNTNCSLYPG